jgi:hypothetical protein
MRVFYLVVVALLVLALGALEVVSARTGLLADAYPDAPETLVAPARSAPAPVD